MVVLMETSPVELQSLGPEKFSISHLLAYKPEDRYNPATLQAMADFFQENFPYGLYPREVEEEQLDQHRNGDQIQKQINEGSTWITATDPGGNITSVLRMAERASGQFHIYWLITDKNHRREGAASELVRQAQDLLPGDESTRVTASVHHENIPSLKLFRLLGYEEFDQTYPEPMEINTAVSYFTHVVKRIALPE